MPSICLKIGDVYHNWRSRDLYRVILLAQVSSDMDEISKAFWNTRIQESLRGGYSPSLLSATAANLVFEDPNFNAPVQGVCFRRIIRR